MSPTSEKPSLMTEGLLLSRRNPLEAPPRVGGVPVSGVISSGSSWDVSVDLFFDFANILGGLNDFLGVDLVAADQHFEMQVLAGRLAGIAHRA